MALFMKLSHASLGTDDRHPTQRRLSSLRMMLTYEGSRGSKRSTRPRRRPWQTWVYVPVRLRHAVSHFSA